MIRLLKNLDFYILLLFVLYVTYYANDHATAVLSDFGLATIQSAVLGKTITIALFLLSFIAIRKSPYCYSNKFVIPLCIWIAVTTISNFLFIDNDTTAVNTSFQQMLWPVVMCYFFHLGRKGTDERMLYVMAITLFVALSFIVYSETILLRSFGQYAENLQVNEIYFLLLLMPWILFMNSNKKWLVLCLLLLTISIWFVLFSYKRTAIFGMAFTAFLFMVGAIKQGKINIRTAIGILIVAVAGYYIYDFVNAQSEGRITERMELMKTDRGSNRLDIYSSVFKGMDTFNIANYLLGAGRGNIGAVTDGYSAHNEFLEVLFSWGFIGLTTYVIFIYRVISTSVRKMVDYIDYPIVLSSLGAYLAMCVTSHLVIYPFLFNLVVSSWAYHMGRYEYTKEYNV